jgi:hypothetical protein
MTVHGARWIRGIVTGGAIAAAVAAGAATQEQGGTQGQAGTPGQSGAAQSQAGTATSGGIDPKAEAVLKRMSHDMTALHSFKFTGDSSTEGVLKNGEKLQFDATSQVAVKRPNKLRSDREGEEHHMVLYYDGRDMSLLGKKANLYATVPAPANLDAAIDFARDRLGLEAPAADLLQTDPYKRLMEGVTAAQDLGEDVVDGIPCEHIAFQAPNTDFQLWVQKNGLALPLKYVITSKDVTGQPEFTVVTRDWQTNANLPDSYFHFVPPPGADRIDFFQNNKQPPTGAGGDVQGNQQDHQQRGPQAPAGAGGDTRGGQ